MAVKKLGIPYQIEADPRPTGTDARAIQVGRGTDLLAAAEVAVLDLQAPTIPAVIEKLSLLWEFELDGGEEESRHRRLVIGDLRRLAFSQA